MVLHILTRKHVLIIVIINYYYFLWTHFLFTWPTGERSTYSSMYVNFKLLWLNWESFIWTLNFYLNFEHLFELNFQMRMIAQVDWILFCFIFFFLFKYLFISVHDEWTTSWMKIGNFILFSLEIWVELKTSDLN